MNHSSMKKVHNAITSVQWVYDEAINYVEEIIYDAIIPCERVFLPFFCTRYCVGRHPPGR